MAESNDKVHEPTCLALSNVQKIVAGFAHSYAITVTDVWAWGSNRNFNIGVDSYEQTIYCPEKMGIKITNIATCSSHSFGWSTTEVFGWGSNINFELGLKQSKYYPVTKLDFFQQALENGFKLVALSCGESHSLAIITVQDKGNRMYTWGSSKSSQLTLDTTYIVPYPVEADFDQQVEAIYSKSDYNVAMADGKLHSWGSDAFGRLGMASSTKKQRIPRSISIDNVKTISLGDYHVVAVSSNGQAYAWGHGLYGQLGVGKNINQVTKVQQQTVPIRVDIDQYVIDVACGEHHTLLLTKQKNIYSCGSNQYGCLGHREVEETNDKKRCWTPKPVYLNNVIAIAAGSRHSMALTESRQVYCWGDNSNGQVGIQHIAGYSSETSIQMEINNVDSLPKDIRLRMWYAKYREFQLRKAEEQRALMAQFEQLIKQ